MDSIIVTPEILAQLLELLNLDPLTDIVTINGIEVIVIYD